MVNTFNELQKEFDTKVNRGELMKLHTTFKIGGPAQYYMNVNKIDDIIKAITIANKLKIPVFIFGGGSNIIVSDNGIKGLVIKNNCRKFEIISMSGKIKERKIDLRNAFVYAESGVLMNQLVRFTIENGLSGLEYQLGLPGTVGGAIFMNSNFPKKGSYVGDCVYKATLLARTGEIKEVNNEYFEFGYDRSIIQSTEEIVLSVVFKLTPFDKKLLWERGMEALRHRNETQPKGASAGCTFRNISIAQASSMPTLENITSAGYFIDKAGLKGQRMGDAMISDLHANFILNMGNAKAEDVIALVSLIKKEVLNKFGIHLSLEVKDIGFSTIKQTQ